MSDEAFKELVGHDPAAPNAVLMSVVVAPAEQGKGYSKLLMQRFIDEMRAARKETIHLKDGHVPLYEKMGYRYVRPSESDHGGIAWHEMVMDLTQLDLRLGRRCRRCRIPLDRHDSPAYRGIEPPTSADRRKARRCRSAGSGNWHCQSTLISRLCLYPTL